MKYSAVDSLFLRKERKIALRVGYCALPLIDLEADCGGGVYYDLGVKWGGGENIGKG